jgi:hypothetical protein
MSYTTGTISVGTQSLKIGAGSAGDNYFNGYIDELRISNIVRDFAVGISTIESENLFSIYPNPAKIIYTSKYLIKLIFQF